MAETIGEKISRKIEEENLDIRSKNYKVLEIFNLKHGEYNRFIEFIKEQTPNKKGYEAINLLLDSFEKSKHIDKLIAYIDELEKKINLLEPKEEKENPKKKYIGGENNELKK